MTPSVAKGRCGIDLQFRPLGGTVRPASGDLAHGGGAKIGPPLTVFESSLVPQLSQFYGLKE